MFELLRDLIAHKKHANAALLHAIRQNRSAADDSEIRALLHHILLANRFWILTILGSPFVIEDEGRAAQSIDELIERYAATERQETAWFDAAADNDPARILKNALIPGGECSVAHAFMQVCLHSHGHRAQCAKLLRRHGVEPPRGDFILWVATNGKHDTARIRLALKSERRALEALQTRASLSNPGDRDALLTHPDAVELPPDQIDRGDVFVLEAEGALKGFAAIVAREDGDGELDALFVEPDCWRRGFGRALVEHCATVARARGATAVHVIGNPHAEGFYRACGFDVVGSVDTRFGKGLSMRRALGEDV